MALGSHGDEGAAGKAAEGSARLVLGIDTATAERSAAVVRGGSVLALVAHGELERPSAGALQEIDAALRRAGVDLREVELFAAAVGPGSFTGLRAGVATMQAFSNTLARPAVGVPTLHAVARASGVRGRVVASIPAGRGEVYAQRLWLDIEGRVTELGPPEHINPRVLLDRLRREDGDGGALTFVGSGARVLREVSGQTGEGTDGRDDARHDPAEGHTHARAWEFRDELPPLAPHVAALALEAYGEGREASAQALRPLYVRPSDVELKERCQS